MQKYNYLSVFFFVLIILSFSCQKPQPKKLSIAVSKLSDSYQQWLLNQDTTLEMKSFYGEPLTDLKGKLEGYDAILITGGEDVYPAYYGKTADTARCGSFDYYRDSLELAMIAYAIENKVPLFGVCRGAQITNVALGGSLIIDIPADFDTLIAHRQKDWRNCFHDVLLDTGSRLFQIAGLQKGMVNSNHHQAVDQIAPALRITARACDGLPEAIEWKDNENNHFLMGVQWHPERLKSDNPLSLNLARAFLKAASDYSQKQD